MWSDNMQKSTKIINWLNNYLNESKTEGFVIGVSGGVDSALTSTLCAMTKKRTVVVSMPIHQEKSQLIRSQNHIDWLCNRFDNVEKTYIDLTDVFESFRKLNYNFNELSLANTRSRLRMATLYSVANTHNLLVAGTGNKIEDYGIGFFTKFGDGGVDISPIADLMKSEVRSMAKELGILDEIVNAIPTDGLWTDSRSDEEQIGASYDDLEWAMQYHDKFGQNEENLSDHQKKVLTIYVKRHNSNAHKMVPPPICLL